jgi:predicted DNA-binding transcriptional regulator YafY
VTTPDQFGLRIVCTWRADRINTMYSMLTPDGAIPVSRFLATLNCSLATFKRDLDFLRTVKKVPVVWDRDNNGYRLKSEHEQDG